ncbi:MAG: response regulator [Blautia sp.]|nr:response regulator [Blautia sp.]
MDNLLIYLMVYAGSILMAYNIYRYIRFSGRVRRHGNWDREGRIFRIPILMLILFLIGYLIVALFGEPDLIIGGILFGGSVFVFVMVLLIERTADRIQENERLEAKLTATEEASKAKSFFLFNMSHDIRTPLNAIIGYTTLANGDGVTLEQKTGYLTKIETAGHQLLDIVNDVLEMSRIENGKIDLEPVCMDLAACVQEAGDLVRNQLEGKKIRFSVECDIAHTWVMCDKHLLTRALMNLLCNAGKFTQEGGSVALYAGELPGSRETGRYEIRVRDTGIGMSPEFVGNLFTPFERERTSTVSRIQGTGLGMAITKNIIDMMQGTIEVETEQNKGTEFVIRLEFPVTDPGEEAGGDDTAGIRFDGVRALLVEDNAVNMEIARLLLEQAGFVIETAENGQTAVDMVTGAVPGYYDLVLMDIQMPVMDGYTAAREIRSLPDPFRAGVPIIAMTANAFQDDIQAAEKAGMNGHIAKPLDVAVMLRTLQTVLDTEG